MKTSRRTSVVVLLTLVTTAFVVLTSTAEAQRPRCFGQRATIVGTAERDQLTGTRRRDVIVARGGNDAIVARGGDDLICSGAGNDNVMAGGGSDRVKEGKGTGFVNGGGGDDELVMGRGFFQATRGGLGADRITSAPFPEGFTFVEYPAPSAVTVDLGAGTASGGHGDDTLVNISGVGGSEHDDTLTGTSGSNFLFGDAGNDTLNDGGNDGSFDMDPEVILDEFHFDAMGGGPGNDTFNGQGAGAHVVFYDEVSSGITVDLQQGTATGEGDDTLNGINVTVGGPGDDTLRGDPQANAFDGGAGTDAIDGRAGDDTLILFDAKNPTVDLAAGAARGEYATFTEQGQSDDAFSWTLTSIENIWGSDRPGSTDTLRGDNGSNEIFGMAGEDELFGLAGNDLLNGGDGTDRGDGGEGQDECVVETPSNCESSPAGFPRPLAARAWSVLMRWV
ncbi:MAG: calcium-binding protein [Actinomycetota bacterium]